MKFIMLSILVWLFQSCGEDGVSSSSDGTTTCTQSSAALMKKWRNNDTLVSFDLSNCAKSTNCEVQPSTNIGTSFCTDSRDFWLIHEDGSWRTESCVGSVISTAVFNICGNTLTLSNFSNKPTAETYTKID